MKCLNVECNASEVTAVSHRSQINHVMHLDIHNNIQLESLKYLNPRIPGCLPTFVFMSRLKSYVLLWLGMLCHGSGDSLRQALRLWA